MAGDESHTNVDGLQLARAALELGRGTVLAGRYEIETALGRGGAGLVLRAHDRELEEAVAIKVLRPELGGSTRWVERLAREVKLARQLRHPNVCRVFDFEKADGHVFIVMELAPGGTLRRELEEGTMRARPIEARLADACAVAAGLGAIHEAGIAHRDVTPQNILRMADGRVVVSDFGLATEVSQTTTSVHGGTIAYMAPEVVRGQRATFTSDVWALGVVIHEIVFGERPNWTRTVGGALVPPGGGRTLTRGERLAFDVCRACMEEEPPRRPKTAGAVAAWLGGGKAVRVGRRRRRGWAALAVGVGGAGVALRLFLPASPPARKAAASGSSLPLVGVPADWSATSKVLAKVEGHVRCMALLPDGHTLRYVSGSPTWAEDLDTDTGRRVPSPLVRQAYLHGCPDLSPDGRRLVFQGYGSDGRSFAFVSEHPDGSGAIPVVPIADPSMDSEPRWLGDSQSFVIEVDVKHMGVFSTSSKRTTILPDATRDSYVTSFHHVIDGRVFITAILATELATEVVGYAWPIMSETNRFRIPGVGNDLTSPDGRILFATRSGDAFENELVRIDPGAQAITRVAKVGEGAFRYPRALRSGLAFMRKVHTSDIWSDAGPEHTLTQITHDGQFFDASPCGTNIIAIHRAPRGGSSVVTVDSSGRILATLAEAAYLGMPTCAADGKTWFVARWSAPTGLDRCDDHGCTKLLDGGVSGLGLSPDGTRLVFEVARQEGPVVVWMAATGGPVHDVANTETNCSPGWSSNRTAWVSRRRNGEVRWTEVDVDTQRETGKTIAGATDCADGSTDEQSPVNPTLRARPKNSAEIRMIPASALMP